jgi:hypothetical protein
MPVARVPFSAARSSSDGINSALDAQQLLEIRSPREHRDANRFGAPEATQP